LYSRQFAGFEEGWFCGQCSTSLVARDLENHTLPSKLMKSSFRIPALLPFANSTYAGMIRSLDQSVGRLMATLDELKPTENTLVVFMSDNGGVSYITKKGDTPTTSNSPFKGGKAMMFEGGIRVPLIFRWPAAIPAGNWSDVPVAAGDLFPTLVQAGGFDPETLRAKHKIDGHSLVSLFKDPAKTNKGYVRDTFIWHYPFNVVPLHPDDGFALTPHSAIRPAAGDPRLEQLLEN
jgi:hypothetical protein